MKCGIVGLPNVGKSTLFNLLTRARQAVTGDFPFCTIKPNYGKIAYYDERISTLAQKNNSQKVIFSTIDLVDIAGLVKDAHQGSGLGNQFLSNIREVDCIIHLIRGFNRENYTYNNEKLSDDYEIINTELLLADLESLDKQIKNPKNQKNSQKISELQYLIDNLPKMVLEYQNNSDLLTDKYKQYNLLSLKPQIVVINTASQTPYDIFKRKTINLDVLELECIRNELLEEDLVIKQTAKLLHSIYKSLNLIHFFTVGPKEARAWVIKKNTLAPEAAGKIHKDFIKHFIKAEVTAYKSKDSRLEGKEYVVQDGDIINFRVGC